MAGGTLTDPDTDQNNPGQKHWDDQTSRFLNAGETAKRDQEHHDGSTLSDDENSKIDDLENNFRSPASDDKGGDWRTNLDKVGKARSKAQNTKNKGRMTMGKRKKTLAALGIGGGAAAIIAIVMMLLPLKLEMFIQNISKHAMATSGYAVEKRLDYLVTRAIAGRMMDTAFGKGAGDVVMCKGGGIACSLYKTYTTKFVEDKFNLKFDTDRLKKTVTVTSRDGIGGKGHAWKIDISELDPQKGLTDAKLTKFLNGAEMHDMIKTHVKSRIPTKGIVGIIQRHIGRKVLMRKYGVTMFHGLDKLKGTYAEKKATLKAKVIKATYGSVSAKLAITMGCIDDPQTCEKTLDEVDKDRNVAKSMLSDADAKKLEGKAGQEFIETLMKTSTKTVAKYALAFGAAATGIGAVLTVDTVISILSLKQDGTLDKAINGIVTAADITFSYGDEIGVVVNNDKFKAGEFDSMDELSLLSSMFDGAEASPLMAAENGISNVSMASLFGGGTASAADGNIKAGQLVPDNRKFNQTIVDDVTGGSVGQEVVNSGSGLIDFWMATAHKVIVAVTDATIGNAIKIATDNPLAQGVIGWASKNATDFMMTFFDFIPQVGIDQPATENYIALSGGIRAEANELMANGVDEDGQPSGAGGQALTSDQVAAIYDTQDADEPKPSYIASLFSPYVRGSLTQQFALMIPSSGIGIVGSIMNIPSAIFAGLNTESYAADISSTVANNPFGQVMYGYPVDSTYFTASPDDYTTATCSESAEAREKSLKHDTKIGVPWKVYTSADPCALEKTVVGAALIDAGVTDDPNSLQDPMTTASNDDSTSGSSSGKCAAGTVDEGSSKLITGASIFICGIPGTSESGQPDGLAHVNADVSGKVLAMIKAMQAETPNKTIAINSSFRSLKEQQYLYNCYKTKSCNNGNKAAPPGTSNHEMGHALDFNMGKPGVYNWLWGNNQANPKKFGFSDNIAVTTENWHFSVNGG